MCTHGEGEDYHPTKRIMVACSICTLSSIDKTAGAYYAVVLSCIFKEFERFDTSNSGLVAASGTSLHRLIAEIGVFAEICRDFKKLEKVLS